MWISSGVTHLNAIKMWEAVYFMFITIKFKISIILGEKSLRRPICLQTT